MDKLVGRDAISGQPVIAQGSQPETIEEVLQDVILQNVDAGNPFALLDIDRRISDTVLAYAVETGRPSYLVLVDLADSNYPLGLNLLDCHDVTDHDEKARSVSRAREVFRKTWTSSWGPRTSQLLQMSLSSLIENPGRTIADLPAFLTIPTFRHEILNAVNDEALLGFWAYFESLGPRRQHESIASTLNRLDELFTQGLVFKIVAQPKTAVDIRSAVESGKPLLVRLPSSVDQPAGVDFLGRVAVAVIINAVDAAVVRPQRFIVYSLEYESYDLQGTS